MLKLNASFSKKVPAESDYSSKSYHAALELELPDGLSEEQIRSRIHQTFTMVKDSVESEINGKPVNNQRPNGHARNNGNGQIVMASKRQVKYLLDLIEQHGLDINAELTRFPVNEVHELTKEQCSLLIDGIRSRNSGNGK